MEKKGNSLSDFKKWIQSIGMTRRSERVFAAFFLFALSFIYFAFSGTGIFYYQENNSLFIFSSDYLHQFTDKPGGLLNYAGNFLTQFYFSNLAGSLIISVMILLAFLAFLKITRLLNTPGPFSLILILLPVSLILLLQTRMDVQVYHLMGFLIVLASFILSSSLQKTVFQVISMLVVPLLYYLAGSFTIIYLGLYILYNLLYRKGYLRYLLPALAIFIAVITFIVYKNYIFFQPVDRLLAYPLLISEIPGSISCMVLFSVVIILLPLFSKLSETVVRNGRLLKWLPVIALITILPLTVIILYRNFEPEIAHIVKFEKMVHAQDWDGVIRLQEKLRSASIVEQFYYNLALAERGQLCSRMFFGRQSYGSMSLTLTRDNEQSFRAMYFYYAIGLTAEAHHLAYELMVQHGYRPECLKMLVKTELINGNFKVAERYINVLKNTFHYKKWTEKYERMLFKPELVKSDPDLGEKFRLLPKKDFFIVTDDFGNLERLLASNPDNRIAFEYKIARLLLEKDLMEVGSNVKKLKDLGYVHIPRHIEEAVVSLVNVTREFPDLGGLLISSDTDQRFIKYFSDLKPFNGNRKLIEKDLRKADQNTFWYYLQFGRIQNGLIKSGPVDNSIY